MIPKNLEYLHKVGIDNISKTLSKPREETFITSHYQTQQNQIIDNVIVNQIPIVNQPQVVNQQPLINQYRTVQTPQPPVVTNTINYQPPQMAPTYQPVQTIRQIQSVPVVQPTQMIGSSGVRMPNVNFNSVSVQQQVPVEQRIHQSQVQTVRPVQTVLIKPIESQKRIQPLPIIQQSPVVVIPPQQIIHQTVTTPFSQQGSRVNQQPIIYNQVPVAKEIFPAKQ